MAAERRLNWGCGEHVAAGWINSDLKDAPHVDLIADVREGLPIATASLDYAVSVHALPELAYEDLVPALRELRRVLKPGGVLRLALPDLDRAIDAYRRGDGDYFEVGPEEVSSLGGRLITQMLWYGYSRSLFTADFAEELLRKAGFERVRRCGFGETSSKFPAIVELDNRRQESFFVEAWKGSADTLREEAPAGKLEVLDIAQQANGRAKGQVRIRAVEGPKLEIAGWAVGTESPAAAVEVLSGSLVAGRAPVSMERPDVADRFPDVAGAGRSGFRLELAAQGVGESELQVRVRLEDGSEEPLGLVTVVAARGRAAESVER
jgi:predicted SAM-dependent methyltransferase